MTAVARTPTSPADVSRELVEMDPAELLIDRNIRQAQPDRTLVASIKAHGVLVAITAVRTAEGAVRVRYGHRRALAAIDAGRATVPVWIAGAEDDDDTDRLLSQWAENEHRAALSEGEKVGAVQQLAAFGLSAAQIARRLHAPRSTIDHAITAAASELARAGLARYDFLTIEQAATVAAFDGDAEAATALIAAAKLGTVEFARAEARATEAVQDRADRAAALHGITCPAIEAPKWSDRENPARRISGYLNGEGEKLTPESHAQCPGAVVWLDREWESPEPGDDAGDDDQDDDGDGDGSRLVYVVVHACADPEQHGHTQPRPTYRTAEATGPAPDDQAAAEARKDERRKVIDGNKAWRTAEPIRRDWLRTLLARKTPPKGTAAFTVAAAINRDGQAGDPHQLAADLLGVPDPRKLPAVAAAATEARAQVIALALVIAGYEAATSVHTWRQERWGVSATRRYFDFLAANGYPLDAIERAAAGIAKPKPARATKATPEPATDEPAQAATASVEKDEVAA